MTGLNGWLRRCTFDTAAGETVDCAFSGGPDSTALIALAIASGLDVDAHHIDHGHRPGTAADAERAEQIATRLGARFHLHRVELDDGPGFEALAREVRRSTLGPDVMTGHTADDLAETVLFRLLRGSGPDGLAAMRPGRTHPILGLRRADTVAVCVDVGVTPVADPTNDDGRFARNRIRHELLPLAAAISKRDVVPLLVRTAELAAEQRDLLEALVADVDPTDARAVAELPFPLASRVVRRWLQRFQRHQYPPDQAAIERVLAVAKGEVVACEVSGGIRVERSQQRLRIVEGER